MNRESLRRYWRLAGASVGPRFGQLQACARLEAAFSRIEESDAPSLAMRHEFEDALRDVLEGVKQGHAVLEFAPPSDGTVTIPARGDAMHLQALVYWTLALRKPFERVLEAARRCGDGASPRAVLETIKKIEFENRMCQTDHFFGRKPH